MNVFKPIGFFLILVLLACQPSLPQEAVDAPSVPATAVASVATAALATASPHLLPPPIVATISPTTPPTATPSPTNTPTSTATATATVSPTPTITPTPPACTQRNPSDDLLTIVTLTYGLSQEYAPKDLVNLTDYFPVEVSLGYPNQIRQVAIQPLVDMIQAMQVAGLHPFIISAYRSYSAQAIARAKWEREAPERADMLSAPPGHSEHQLGTAVDFGSPELKEIVGDPNVEFHTYFYQTSEGEWLAAHAHEYGFTLSYTRDAQELTGFYYEPWHYRYVGVDLATTLHDTNTLFTAYQLQNLPLPCVP